MSGLHFALSSSRSAGFSLVELAVVMMIVGTLMSGVLVAVSQTTDNTRRTTAKAQLREIEEALYGYAQLHGHLPCPATATSDGIAAPDGSSSACTARHGFVPAATLGLYGNVNGDGLLLDPWQNPYRYSVSLGVAASSTNPSFTETAAIKAFFATGNSLTSLPTTNLLKICSDTSCSAGNITNPMLPAIVLSMGENWASYTSAAEQLNAGNGSTQLGGYNVHTSANNATNFTSLDYSEDSFDDMMVWISPYVLFNRMVNAGKLP